MWSANGLIEKGEAYKARTKSSSCLYFVLLQRLNKEESTHLNIDDRKHPPTSKDRTKNPPDLGENKGYRSSVELKATAIQRY